MRHRAVHRNDAVVVAEVEQHQHDARRLVDLEPASRRRARHAVETERLWIRVEALFLAGPSAGQARADLVAPGERPRLIRDAAAGRIGDIRLLWRAADIDVVVFLYVVAAIRSVPRALQL